MAFQSFETKAAAFINTVELGDLTDGAVNFAGHVTGTRIGAGNDDPIRELHITGTAAQREGGLLYALNQPVIIEDATRPGIHFIGSEDNIAIIEAGDHEHPNAMQISMDHSTNLIRFGFEDNYAQVYFDSSGNAFTVGGLRSGGKFTELAHGTSGTPSGDAGIIIERGSSDNAAILWDEDRDEFVFCTTSATGASTGDLTFTPANLSVERLGAGTEQPEAKIHVKNDTASSPTYSTNAVLIVEDNDRPFIQLVGSANNIGGIQFGDNAAAFSAMIYFDHSTDTLRFDAGGNTDRLTVDADGDATFAGDVTIGSGAEEDTMVVWDGAEADFRIGLDDGTNALEIGAGVVHGTTAAITISSAGRVTGLALGAAAVTVADDYIMFLDGGATGEPKVESIADFVTAMAERIMTNGANNYLVTATGTDAMNAEANARFDGSTLAVTGGLTVTTGIEITANEASDVDAVTASKGNGADLGGTTDTARKGVVSYTFTGSGDIQTGVSVRSDIANTTVDTDSVVLACTNHVGVSVGVSGVTDAGFRLYIKNVSGGAFSTDFTVNYVIL